MQSAKRGKQVENSDAEEVKVFWFSGQKRGRKQKGGTKSTVIVQKNGKNEDHLGFPRSHEPYYWPGLNKFNFSEQTRGGVVVLV